MSPEIFAQYQRTAGEMAATIICRVGNAGWVMPEQKETLADEHLSAILTTIAELNADLCKRSDLPQAGAVALFEARERLRKELAGMGMALLTPSNMPTIRNFLSMHKLLNAPAPDVLAA